MIRCFYILIIVEEEYSQILTPKQGDNEGLPLSLTPQLFDIWTKIPHTIVYVDSGHDSGLDRILSYE